MTKEEAINILIKDCDTNKITDGYHTFGELYEHRITLFIVLCHILQARSKTYDIWKSKKHSDGSNIDGWFVLGIGKVPGYQITYHIPISKWDMCEVKELELAPIWDGHTSEDVLSRLKTLLCFI